MQRLLQSVNRTAFLVAFVAACVLFPPLPASAAAGVGNTPVLSATPGDGEVDLSWTEWVPPNDLPADWMVGAQIDYRWRMKAEGEDWSDWTYVDGTSTTVPDLENGKEYTFVVVGRQRGQWPDGGGRWLRLSWPSIEVTVAPTAPE